MRNSQYFGLMCVLASIAAGVINLGIVRGFFILAAVASAGLAIYFFVFIEAEWVPREAPQVDPLEAEGDAVAEAGGGATAENEGAVAAGPKPPGLAVRVESPIAWLARTAKHLIR